MSYTYYKIERVPFYNNQFHPTETEVLTDFSKLLIRMSLGEGKDSFSFEVKNFNNKYNNKFNISDKIIIYRKINSTVVTDADVLMIGVVNDLPSEMSASKNYIKVKGYNLSESILRGLVFLDFYNRDVTIPDAMQEALQNIRNINPNFSVTWDYSNPEIKSDGTAFPFVVERFYYKPFKDFIERYSMNTYTHDGAYYWYVTKNNQLRWDKRLNISSGSFNSGTSLYKELKHTKDVKGIINFIIIKGGLDPKGKQIQNIYQDPASISKNGMKHYYLVDETNAAKNLNMMDMNMIGAKPEDGTLPSKVLGTSYSFTPLWLGTAVTNDDEYVEYLRAYVKIYLKTIAKSFVELRKNGKLKIEINAAPGVYSWVLGEVISCTIPEISSKVMNLRVVDIQYGETQDAFELEEDKGSL